jgi:hypothetical protein
MHVLSFCIAGCCSLPPAAFWAAITTRRSMRPCELPKSMILCKSNDGGAIFTKLVISAVQQYPHDCGVEHADGGAIVKQARIVDVLEPVMNQHRLVVCLPTIKQDFKGTKLIEGERGPLQCLSHQLTRVVRAKGAPA